MRKSQQHQKNNIEALKEKRVVLHLIYSFGRGGMENGVVKLINNMNCCVYFHIIVAFTDDVSIASKLINNNYILIILDKTVFISRFISLIKIVNKYKVNIVHARGWPTMLEGALLGLLIPKLRSVFSFHGRSFDELSGITWKRKYLQIVLAKLFDQVVTLTSSMKNEIARDFKLAAIKIKVVPNGIPERVANPGGTLVRSELGIGENDLVIGCVGRLDPVKNIDTLIHAFNKLSNECDNCWLMIVGEGPEEAKLKILALEMSNHDRILFTGFKENVFELMEVFDVYVQASFYEGLSNTILEAMSMGLTLICSNVGGNCDIISQGENGFLFECEDISTLSDYLRTVLADGKQREFIASRNVFKARNLYSIDKMVKGYEQIYEDL